MRGVIDRGRSPLVDAAEASQVRTADLGSIRVVTVRSSAPAILRSPHAASDAPPPSLMVAVIDHGMGVIVHGSRAVILHPGDIGLYLTDEPYRLECGADTLRHTYEVPLAELHLPREVIAARVRTAHRPDHATTAAVSAFLRSTARTAPGAPASERAALHRPTVDLIRLLLTRPAGEEPVGRGAAAVSLATRVEEHVRTSLGDPGLSARTIAATFSISPRYVYAILARRGIDLGELIREHRLERAHRLLADPTLAGATIAAVAGMSGFSDHAHFSRSFRARYGMSPSQWRARIF